MAFNSVPPRSGYTAMSPQFVGRIPGLVQASPGGIIHNASQSADSSIGSGAQMRQTQRPAFAFDPSMGTEATSRPFPAASFEPPLLYSEPNNAQRSASSGSAGVDYTEQALFQQRLQQMFNERLRGSAQAILTSLCNDLPSDHVLLQLMCDATSAQFIRYRVSEVVENSLASLNHLQCQQLMVELAQRDVEIAHLQQRLQQQSPSMSAGEQPPGAALDSSHPHDRSTHQEQQQQQQQQEQASEVGNATLVLGDIVAISEGLRSECERVAIALAGNEQVAVNVLESSKLVTAARTGFSADSADATAEMCTLALDGFAIATTLLDMSTDDHRVLRALQEAISSNMKKVTSAAEIVASGRDRRHPYHGTAGVDAPMPITGLQLEQVRARLRQAQPRLLSAVAAARDAVHRMETDAKTRHAEHARSIDERDREIATLRHSIREMESEQVGRIGELREVQQQLASAAALAEVRKRKDLMDDEEEEERKRAQAHSAPSPPRHPQFDPSHLLYEEIAARLNETMALVEATNQSVHETSDVWDRRTHETARMIDAQAQRERDLCVRNEALEADNAQLRGAMLTVAGALDGALSLGPGVVALQPMPAEKGTGTPPSRSPVKLPRAVVAAKQQPPQRPLPSSRPSHAPAATAGASGSPRPAHEQPPPRPTRPDDNSEVPLAVALHTLRSADDDGQEDAADALAAGLRGAALRILEKFQGLHIELHTERQHGVRLRCEIAALSHGLAGLRAELARLKAHTTKKLASLSDSAAASVVACTGGLQERYEAVVVPLLRLAAAEPHGSSRGPARTGPASEQEALHRAIVSGAGPMRDLSLAVSKVESLVQAARSEAAAARLAAEVEQHAKVDALLVKQQRQHEAAMGLLEEATREAHSSADTTVEGARSQHQREISRLEQQNEEHLAKIGALSLQLRALEAQLESRRVEFEGATTFKAREIEMLQEKVREMARHMQEKDVVNGELHDRCSTKEKENARLLKVLSTQQALGSAAHVVLAADSSHGHHSHPRTAAASFSLLYGGGAGATTDASPQGGVNFSRGSNENYAAAALGSTLTPQAARSGQRDGMAAASSSSESRPMSAPSPTSVNEMLSGAFSAASHRTASRSPQRATRLSPSTTYLEGV